MEIEKGKYVRTNDMVQAEGPPALTDVLTVEERPEPACILDHVVTPRRRLREKTALSALSARELQDRLHRGQVWANEEFNRMESFSEGEGGSIAHVCDLDGRMKRLKGWRNIGLRRASIWRWKPLTWRRKMESCSCRHGQSAFKKSGNPCHCGFHPFDRRLRT